MDDKEYLESIAGMFDSSGRSQIRDIVIDLLLSLANVTNVIMGYCIYPNVKDLKIVKRVFGIDDNMLWLLRCEDGLDDISFDVDNINHILLDTNQIIIVFEEDILERERS